jgi:hypothetical protein
MSEVINDVSTEMDPSTPAHEVVSDVTPTIETTPSEGNAVVAPTTPEVPVTPAYTPSYKYSVRGQEKEISEKYRALIKTAEDEKELKELFEKAEGLDFVKQDRSSLKQEYEGFKQQITPYLQDYNKFTTLRDKGNLGAAFQVAGISDDQIFEYAVQRLQMEQNPHQAQLYKNHNDASLQMIEMEGKIQQYQQMEQSIQAQQFEYNLTQALGAHKDVVDQIEQKWGKPGSFRDEVVSLGISEFNQGRHLTEQQAVEAVVNKYKPFVSQATPQATQAQPYQRPATIPNVGTSNISVISKKPKSIDDLKAMAREEVG